MVIDQAKNDEKLHTHLVTADQGVAGLMTPCGEFTGHPLMFRQRLGSDLWSLAFTWSFIKVR